MYACAAHRVRAGSVSQSATQTASDDRVPIERGRPVADRRAFEFARLTVRGESTVAPIGSIVVHRNATNKAPVDEVPPIVHDVLTTSGRPLDSNVQTSLEKQLARAYHSTGAGRERHMRATSSPISVPEETAEREAEHVSRAISPLPEMNRRLDSRFDFSHVRIHIDERAAESARAMNAHAYTVGRHLVFGAGKYAPNFAEGRTLLAHELTHVIQETGPGSSVVCGTSRVAVRRKVILKDVELSFKERQAFVKKHKWKNAPLAASVMDDMAAAGDAFDFANDHELETEITKRTSTVRYIEESQETVERIPGDKRAAFGYPFTGASALYGPRVNYAAREYWDPAVPDAYAVRTDKKRNAELVKKPRHERCSVYGDPCGDYGWKLSPKGQKDPYSAIVLLFKQQSPHKRTLIHCDYLISLVNFMSLADSLGATEFNKRVAAFGASKIFLKYNAFLDLNLVTFERTATGTVATSATGRTIEKSGLGSTQRIKPSSEADLVIGDHVVFFNHVAYDLINKNIGNAWRLENAVLVRRERGKDVFLGHGSLHKTADMMLAKLSEEYNVVAQLAIDLVGKTKSSDKKAQTTARTDLGTKFPFVKDIGGEMHVTGIPDLLAAGCARTVDEKLRRIGPNEVLGLKSPCDPTTLNEVERPIESAK